jgi:hypothetical protein
MQRRADLPTGDALACRPTARPAARPGRFSTLGTASRRGLSTIGAGRSRNVDNRIDSRHRPVYRPDSARLIWPAAEDGAHEGPGETRP